MAEKLVNDAGLAEFAVKIKESVPLIDTTSSGGSGFSIDSMGSYSLDEVETPFTWINGKRIYKKTVVPTSAGNISFSSLGLDSVETIWIDMSGTWLDINLGSGTRRIIPGMLWTVTPAAGGGDFPSQCGVFINKLANYLVIEMGSNCSFNTGAVTLCYTKS